MGLHCWHASIKNYTITIIKQSRTILYAGVMGYAVLSRIITLQVPRDPVGYFGWRHLVKLRLHERSEHVLIKSTLSTDNLAPLRARPSTGIVRPSTYIYETGTKRVYFSHLENLYNMSSFYRPPSDKRDRWNDSMDHQAKENGPPSNQCTLPQAPRLVALEQKIEATTRSKSAKGAGW